MKGVMNGYLGKLLIVDLTRGEIREEPLNAEYGQKFIGGSGLACRYLYDLIDSHTDPLESLLLLSDLEATSCLGYLGLGEVACEL